MFNAKSHFSRLCRDRFGNVAMIFAFVLPVVIFAIGVVVDYGMQSRAQTRLRAYADEAALAAVSYSAMSSGNATQQNVTTAAANANAIFMGQAASVTSVTLDPPTGGSCGTACYVTLSAADTFPRTATVTYTGAYKTIFSGILGISSLSVSGTSVAQSSSSQSPNINFYVLADNSGSMSLPATQAGVTKMQSLTPSQLSGGCAFACHEASPNTAPSNFAVDNIGNPCDPTIPNNTGSNCLRIDNYTLARNNGITLRFDEVNAAITQLLQTADSNLATLNPPPTYQFGIYSVDGPYTQGMYTVMPLSLNYDSAWSADSSNLALYTVYSDGQACGALSVTGCLPGLVTASGSTYLNVGFLDTTFADKMQWFQSNIPTAGTGVSGSAAQQVLFIITDGVEDTVVNGAISITTFDSATQSACTALKSKGVKIAILYTTYYPVPGFWLYDDYVANFQSTIPTALQTCASPGLYLAADVNGNIPNTLSELFNLATQNPRLTQ